MYVNNPVAYKERCLLELTNNKSQITTVFSLSITKNMLIVLIILLGIFIERKTFSIETGVKLVVNSPCTEREFVVGRVSESVR
jgi:hypothetical protein